MILVQGFHKAYRDTVAVSDLSFEVCGGQILGLLGPNGAGKTTTLRAMAGIIPPTRGQISVAGHDVVRDPVAAKRELAYVPDDPKLFDTLTVWEHFEFIASVYRVPDLPARATQLLEQFDLTAKRNTIAAELSRGMRQKVAICCAYLHQPKAMLFDEPLTGLDPHAIRTLRHSVIDHARSGGAVVMSSHLLSLVQDLCTHLLILNHGQCQFNGTVEDARAAFADAPGDKSLEGVFFRATDGRPVAPAP